MYKGYRFAFLSFVLLLGFYLIYPTVYWYFILSSDKKNEYLQNQYEKTIHMEEKLRKNVKLLQKLIPIKYHRIKDFNGENYVLNIRPRREIGEKRVLPNITDQKLFSLLMNKIYGVDLENLSSTDNNIDIQSVRDLIKEIQSIENYFLEMERIRKIKKSIISIGLDLAGGTHLTIGVDKYNLVEKIKDKYHLNYGLNDNNEIEDIILNAGNVDFNKITFDDKKLKDSKSSKEEVLKKYQTNLYADLKEAVNQAMVVIRNRINRFGVSEIKITKSLGSNIFMELPGTQNKDVEETIENITKAGKLTFQRVNEEYMRKLPSFLYNTNRNYLEYIDPKYVLKKGNSFEFNPSTKEDLEKNYSIFLSKNPSESNLYPIEEISEFGHSKIIGFLILRNMVEMEGENLESLNIGYEETSGHPFIAFSIKDEDAIIHFSNMTEKNINKQLVILLDNTIKSVATISNKIIKNGQISLSKLDPNPLKEARELLNILKAGSLPTKLNILNINKIGPTLGYENIKKGFSSMILGLVLVVLFMLFYYKISGIIAVFALFLNLFILLSILSAFGFTLTLPGICGIILTIGMVIDANVIIFERVKEERKDLPLIQSVNNAYKKAFSAIFDANLTTIFAAFILSNVGSGLIKGFGFTLMWGIITSMFTSLFVTKLIFDFILYRIKFNKFII